MPKNKFRNMTKDQLKMEAARELGTTGGAGRAAYGPANLTSDQLAELRRMEEGFANKAGRDVVLVAYKDQL